MTPEERYQIIRGNVRQGAVLPHWSELDSQTQGTFAQALRDVRNDALEEAAALVEMQLSSGRETLTKVIREWLPQKIRSLKSNP